MRITKNATPGSTCSLCGKPLELGRLGANFMPSLNLVSRAHLDCLQRWKNAELRAEIERQRRDIP